MAGAGARDVHIDNQGAQLTGVLNNASGKEGQTSPEHQAEMNMVNQRNSYMLNLEKNTYMKDAVDNGLGMDRPGPGYTHFPDWLGGWFYRELTAEA